MVLLLEPGYDSIQANPLAQAKRQWILPDREKRVDAGYDRGHCDCWFCNAHKGPNLSSIDPDTGGIVPLFNPRVDTWSEHFLLVEHRIVGLTAIGRATTTLLNMNDPDRVQVRAELATLGRDVI